MELIATLMSDGLKKHDLKIVALQLGVTLKSLYDLSWGCSRDLVADETLSLGGTLGHSDRVLLNHLKEPKITK